MKYKFIEHTADIQFRAYGKNIEKAFENSLKALKKSITKERIKTKKQRKISVKGNDLENLLYNFLEEVLFLFDSEYFIPSKISELNIDEEGLTLFCILKGDSGDYNCTHIKAITYNKMFVKKEKNKWVIQVVLDV